MQDFYNALYFRHVELLHEYKNTLQSFGGKQKHLNLALTKNIDLQKIQEISGKLELSKNRKSAEFVMRTKKEFFM